MITPVSNCYRRRKTAAAFNRRLLFFGIFLCISALFDGRAFAEQVKFRRISIEQGLSQSNVNAITQDHQGFMWFGTQDGLSRYDGYSFTTYRNKPDNPQSISDNYIWSIFCDSKGNLWVGTQGGGLNRYLPETDGFENFKNIPGDNSSILSNNITNIIEDRDGQLWFACWSGGISRWIDTENGFRNYSPNPEDSTSLIDANVGILLEDAHQNLWAGTWNGLAMLPKSARNRVNLSGLPIKAEKTDCPIRKSGRCWKIATRPAIFGWHIWQRIVHLSP
ncbi:MAG: two-component regulator propeller domain-containing protein [Calditrichia bacterium]